MTTLTTGPIKRTMSPAATQKPVTAKPTAANRGATFLKTTLVAGGILATLLGANLAARQDQVATTTAMTTTYTTNAQAVAVLPNLPAADQGTSDPNAILNMPLAPIPSLNLPTVTRSQSSR